MDPVRLSALGRAVKVGDFYNYYNDSILPGEIFVFWIKFKYQFLLSSLYS
jgi:hypothetical protein